MAEEKKPNIKTKIREVAKEALIMATDELVEFAERELEKKVTPEWLESIRAEMMKAKRGAEPAPAKPKA